MFDRSFNGASFDVHDGPVRCCHAVPRSNDCQTVAAHEASGGKSTERVQLQLHARVWTKTQLHGHARVWTKTQGRGRKLVAIQTVAQVLPAADCVDRIDPHTVLANSVFTGTHTHRDPGLTKVLPGPTVA